MMSDTELKNVGNLDYSAMTDEEVKLDILKAAIMNAELFETMRRLMVDHPNPARLDPYATRLRRIFMELESHDAHT